METATLVVACCSFALLIVLNVAELVRHRRVMQHLQNIGEGLAEVYEITHAQPQNPPQRSKTRSMFGDCDTGGRYPPPGGKS